MVKPLWENLPVKVAALLLAVILWFHVSTERRVEHSLAVPLTYTGLDSSLVFLKLPPPAVEVRVRGTGKAVLKAIWQKKAVPVKLDLLGPGNYDRLVRQADLRQALDPELEILELIQPKSLTFSLDRVEEKTVKIESRVTVEPALGYFWNGELTFEPVLATVRGPQQALAKIEKVFTDTAHLRGTQTPLVATLRLLAPDSFNVSLVTPTVIVRAPVEKVSSLVLDSIPVKTLISALQRVAWIRPNLLRLTLEGPESALRKIDRKTLKAVVNCSRLKAGRHWLVPQVSVPPPVVVDAPLDSVEVRIE